MDHDLREAIRGTAAPQEIADELALVEVDHLGFDGEVHRGRLVIAKDMADEVRAIFAALLEARFPIERMVPIVEYGWSDDASMAANNSSAFNYRVIAGTDRLSHHATGRAIDLNPLQNPYIVRGASIPPGLVYDPHAKGAIADGVVMVRTFLAHGWEWGGHWNPAEGTIDYQHFQKPRG